MKCIVSLLIASAALAQQQSSVATRSYDINGRPVDGVQSVQSSGGSRSQITRDVNGRTVPVESTEEKVISDSGGLRVVERIVKRYDPNGNPSAPERVRIEEQKQADGSVRTVTTVSRADVNGGYQVAERATALSRTSGDRTEVTTAVERPTLNGGYELYERREESLTKSPSKSMENATVYRRDPNGRLSEFAKKTREMVSANGQVNENIAEYETASTGQMRIERQSTVRVDPSGTREVNLYGPDPQGNMVLKQQQTIQKRETPGGSVETTVVRLADPNNPGRLGAPRKVEESVCTGECGKKKPSAVPEVHQPANPK